METFIRLMQTRGIRWAGSVFAVLVALLLVGLAKPTHAENERVISIFHDGIQQTIVTDATTIGDALKRANVSVDSHDAVEPGADTKLTAPAYDVNIYRARPVTVIDGASRYDVMSPHTSARQIAADAGLTLYDEDKYQLTRIDDFVAEGGVGLKLTIDRAVPLNLTLYGKANVVRTQATTVGGLLKEKHIALGAQDGTNVPDSTPITADMNVEVWRNGVQTITEEKQIDFPIKQIRDADHEIGYHDVKTKGVLGKKQVTYQIEMKNGKEISRKEIQSLVTAQPQEQVEAIGVKPKSGPADPAANQALGHQMMLAAGYGENEWPCLLNLWNRESGWDQHKANKQGSGAYGIPQALPGSKMGAGWQDDPAVQISWGLTYIKKYGGPCGAWSHWQAAGSY